MCRSLSSAPLLHEYPDAPFFVHLSFLLTFLLSRFFFFFSSLPHSCRCVILGTSTVECAACAACILLCAWCVRGLYPLSSLLRREKVLFSLSLSLSLSLSHSEKRTRDQIAKEKDRQGEARRRVKER